MRQMNRIAVSVLLASCLIGAGEAALAQTAVAPPPPATVPDRAQLEKRLESVKTLLEKSSAARQIEASANPVALAERAKAMEIWHQAKAAFDAGDLPATQKLLMEAPKMLFAAARHSAPEQVQGEKIKTDYLNRRESVNALLVAQKRISDEKGSVSGAGETAKNIEQLLSEADQLAAAGKYQDARDVADKAYLLAKASVGQMRSGDTLVRSLNFANKEEEFKYEIDRNDSLTMLYKVLIEQSGKGNPSVTEQVKKGFDIRVQAEKSAAGGDHAGGVKLLEESTTQLIRAIRSAGIFIPG